MIGRVPVKRDVNAPDQQLPASNILLDVIMFKSFLKDETGLELSEYAVAAALIAIAAAGVFTALGTSISSKVNELGGHIKSGK